MAILSEAWRAGAVMQEEIDEGIPQPLTALDMVPSRPLDFIAQPTFVAVRQLFLCEAPYKFNVPTRSHWEGNTSVSIEPLPVSQDRLLP